MVNTNPPFIAQPLPTYSFQ